MGFKILIGTYYMNKPQGTQTWVYTLASVLKRMGHDPTVMTFRGGYVGDTLRSQYHMPVKHIEPVEEKFDFTICNHGPVVSHMKQYRKNTGPIVCFIHGIHPAKEQPVEGADYYVAISREVQDYVMGRGFKVSAVVPNFVDTTMFYCYRRPAPEPKTLFYLSWYRRLGGMLKRVCERKRLRFMELPEEPVTMFIADKLCEADIVVSLGRGVCEAMAAGRVVFVGDHSTVIGSPMGDGLLLPGCGEQSLSYNFNGKGFKMPLTEEFIESELDKYDYSFGTHWEMFAQRRLDVGKAIKRIFELVGVV